MRGSSPSKERRPPSGAWATASGVCTVRAVRVGRYYRCAQWLRVLRFFSLSPSNFALLGLSCSLYLFAFNSLGLSSLDTLVARTVQQPLTKPDAAAHGQPRRYRQKQDGDSGGGGGKM